MRSARTVGASSRLDWRRAKDRAISVEYEAKMRDNLDQIHRSGEGVQPPSQLLTMQLPRRAAMADATLYRSGCADAR